MNLFGIVSKDALIPRQRILFILSSMLAFFMLSNNETILIFQGKRSLFETCLTIRMTMV